MGFYWIIPFVAVLILATLNGAIIASSKKDKIKYSLLAFNTSLIFWACFDVTTWIATLNAFEGLVIEKLMSIFWISIGFLFLNFVYSLLKLKRDIAYYISFIITCGTILISVFSNMVLCGIEKEYWGIFPVFGEWMLLALAVVLIPMFYGLLLILKARIKETDKNIKEIYTILVIGTCLTVFIDSTVDVLLPILFGIKIISLATFGNSLLSLFLLWIINKHQFLQLSTEEISKDIFDKVNEGVILTSQDGQILMMNESARVLIENNESSISQILNQDNTKESIFKIKVQDATTGENKYLNITNNTITDRVKRQFKLLLLNDVTELVKYRNSILDKNEELNITLYRIGHDIKGPASAIKQLVLFSKTDKENIDVYLDKIEISINQLTNFIQEVETLIRIKEASALVETINLNSILERCWAELEYYRQFKNHQLITEIDCKTFKSDPNLLYSILLNILSNAIKYHDILNKGENRIKVKACTTEKKELELEISDNGYGMNEETVNNIYKLFYRGDSKINGTGLGMYIVKHSILKLNGSINIISQPGIGTTFKITIPIHFS